MLSASLWVVSNVANLKKPHLKSGGAFCGWINFRTNSPGGAPRAGLPYGS